MMTSATQLPEDVLLCHVFPFLQNHFDYVTLRRICFVSRRWARLVSCLLWREVQLTSPRQFQAFNHILCLPTEKLFTDYFTHVHNLFITTEIHSNMESLNSDEELDDDDDDDDFFGSPRRMQNTYLPDSFFRNLAVKCTNLRQLHFGDIPISSEQLRVLTESVALQKSLRALSMARCLEFDDSGGFDQVSERDIQQLGNLRCLRHLIIGSRNLTNEAFCAMISPLSKLMRLDVIQCADETFDDYAVMKLADSCPELRQLQLPAPFHTHAFSDEAVEKLVKSCRMLTYLAIAKSDVTDRLFEILAENCTYLETLDVTGNRNITQQAIESFVGDGRMKCLRRVIAINCRNLNTKVYIYVTKKEEF